MPLSTHPQFPQLAPFIQVQIYDRDGGHSHPRYRIELRNSTPPAMRQMALALEAPCAACGRPIHPFRERSAPAGRGTEAQTVYVAAACPLDVNVGCSRGSAARDEYIRIREAVDAWRRNTPEPPPPPAPPDIFDMQDD